jgi:hypothetical protein
MTSFMNNWLAWKTSTNLTSLRMYETVEDPGVINVLIWL